MEKTIKIILQVIALLLVLELINAIGIFTLKDSMENAQKQECYILSQEIDAGDYTQDELDNMPYYEICGLGE